MNEKEKLEFIKKEITGLNYLNLVLTDDISYHRNCFILIPLWKVNLKIF